MMLNVNITNDALNYSSNRTRPAQTRYKPSRQSFTLDIGFNLHDSIGDLGAGDIIDNPDPVDRYQPFSKAAYQYQLNKTSSIEVQVAPNETRRNGLVKQNFTLDGHTYNEGNKDNEGDDVIIALRQWSAGASYLKDYTVSDQITLTGGIGLYAYYVELEADL
ncbi:hypothetical protein [Vibrio mexicanus]|uniref:hypothetical protein n=1 Tax=Vibrio mexicanus TaxID=1004326 RepID=UPI000A651C06|nr:hypothetical protein [Vibrio mexicanus]